MKSITLMYHDIVEKSDRAASGFPGGSADRYKVDNQQFEAHLMGIAKTHHRPPELVTQIGQGANAFMLTFDDGGRDAYYQAADALERHGWRGHFFIATDFIDSPGFLTRGEIRRLAERGHIIGSHSASHPLRMGDLTANEIRREWKRSVGCLSDILGFAVTAASIPGGQFTKQVAAEASAAGIKWLFTSEPTTSVNAVGEARVLGRFTIQCNTPTETVVALARGDRMPRLQQFLLWNSKKALKKIGGKGYLKIRSRLLSDGKVVK